MKREIKMAILSLSLGVLVLLTITSVFAAFCCKDVSTGESKCWASGTCCSGYWYEGCQWGSSLYCGCNYVQTCIHCKCESPDNCYWETDASKCGGTESSCECIDGGSFTGCIDCSNYYGDECGFSGSQCSCESWEQPVWSCVGYTCTCSCSPSGACENPGDGFCSEGESYLNELERGDCCKADCTACVPGTGGPDDCDSDGICHAECAGYNGCSWQTDSCDGVTAGYYICCDNQRYRQCCEGTTCTSCGPDHYECCDSDGPDCGRQLIDWQCSGSGPAVTDVCSYPPPTCQDCGYYTCSAGSCTSTLSLACGAECENDGHCEHYEECQGGVCYDLRNDVSGCDYYDYCSANLGNLDACKTATLAGDYSYCKVYGKTNAEMYDICKDALYADHALITC